MEQKFKYFANSYSRTIEKRPIEKETACFVWVDGDRCQKKITGYSCIVNTWSDARDFLLNKANENTISITEQIQYLKNDLEKARIKCSEIMKIEEPK